jgi:hypothetical protein
VAPVFDGGSPVIDYAVWFDNATGGELALLEAGIIDLSYTSVGLV